MFHQNSLTLTIFFLHAFISHYAQTFLSTSYLYIFVLKMSHSTSAFCDKEFWGVFLLIWLVFFPALLQQFWECPYGCSHPHGCSSAPEILLLSVAAIVYPMSILCIVLLSCGSGICPCSQTCKAQDAWFGPFHHPIPAAPIGLCIPDPYRRPLGQMEALGMQLGWRAEGYAGKRPRDKNISCFASTLHWNLCTLHALLGVISNTVQICWNMSSKKK